ncbi:unnamed protein product [Linum trigynum]|uniref:Uncharacterized protein n=1 Tax=Linum trigynum TaxID=586398 RepID=A0AAV2GMS5_9ROSI
MSSGLIGRRRDERWRVDKLHSQSGKTHNRAWWPCKQRCAIRVCTAVHDLFFVRDEFCEKLHGQALGLHGACNGHALPSRN